MPVRPFSCPSPHLRLLLQGLQATLRRRGVACHVVHFLPWYHQVVSTRTKQLGRRPFWKVICTWEIGEAFSLDIFDIFRHPFIILGYQNHVDMLGIQNHGSRFFPQQQPTNLRAFSKVLRGFCCPKGIICQSNTSSLCFPDHQGSFIVGEILATKKSPRILSMKYTGCFVGILLMLLLIPI